VNVIQVEKVLCSTPFLISVSGRPCPKKGKDTTIQLLPMISEIAEENETPQWVRFVISRVQRQERDGS
jgi:hypothetical protein